MRDLAMDCRVHMSMKGHEPLEEPVPRIGAEAQAARKLHSHQATTMRRLHSFGSAGREREKPGCAWALLAANWWNRLLPPMPAQLRQVVPQ